MKKNMMTAAALMMAAIALTACGKAEQTASPANDSVQTAAAIRTELPEESTATSSVFTSEPVSEAVTVLQTEVAQTSASAAKQTEAKKAVAETKKTVAEAKKNNTAAKKQTTAEKQKETVSKPKNTAENQQNAEADRKAIAKELINSYCYINDSFCYGCSLPVEDEAVIVEIEGCDWDARYHKVTVPNQEEVTSLADVKRRIGQVLTGAAYDDAVKVATCGEHPIYTEMDGSLYILELGKGTLFGDWLWDTMTISSITEKGFTAEVQMRSYGDLIDTCRFDFVDISLGATNDFRVSSFVCE